MEVLGKRLGEAVRERLDHDPRVVVARVARERRFDADTGGDCKCADVIRHRWRPDEIREAVTRTTLGFHRLLAKMVEPGDLDRARLVRVDHEVVVAEPVARPEPESGARLRGRPSRSARRASRERRRRGFGRWRRPPGHRRWWDTCPQAPTSEERRPVDVGDQRLQRHLARLHPERPRHRRRVLRPIQWNRLARASASVSRGRRAPRAAVRSRISTYSARTRCTKPADCSRLRSCDTTFTHRDASGT
jgi:hypothetical protein